MATIAGCGPDQISENNLAFETTKGITNRDGTASIVATATGFTITGVVGLTGGTNITDGDALTFGTGGTDLVMTADGTDVVVTATGDLVLADSVDLKIGTGKDLGLVHDGTNSTISNAVGDLIIDNTDVNDQIIVRVGTDTTATGIEFRNNSDVAVWKIEPTSATAGRLMGADASAIILGAGSDDTIAHDGTLTTWTHTTGDLVIDSTDVDDQIILRVGTDTTATGVEIRNNSDVAVWKVEPTSATAGRLVGADGSALVLGTGLDDSVAHDGTDTTWTHATGDLIIDNTAATKKTVARLGTDTSATAFEVRNNSDAALLAVGGDGATVVSGSLRVTGKIVATGTSALIDAEHVDLRANYLFQNLDYVTAAAVTGGRVVNYLPTATVDTTLAAGVVTAGVDGVSDPTITTAGAATFAITDLVMISGSANNGENDGIYEVQAHAANTLTLKSTSNGISNRVEDFTLDQLVANAGDTGMAITKVTISVDRVGTDGRMEHGSGSQTGIVFADLIKVGDDAVFNTVDINGIADALIVDADGDTTISAPVDDQIDIEIAGADDFTFTANSFNVLTGSSVSLADSCVLNVGTGNDLQITHNGTDTIMTSAVGDLVFDNTDVNDQIVLRVGTDTSDTGVEVRNNSDAVLFSVNGAGTAAFTGPVTTTDGVASGTARAVGGKAFGIIADATHVDPAGGGDAAETVVSTYTIPASSIKAGTKIRVDFAYVVTTGATVETLVMRLRLGGVGGTVVAASTSMDPATGSGSGYAILVGHAAPGAAAEVAHFGVVKDFAAAGSDSAVVQLGPTLTNFATNGALDLVLTADFAAAEAAGGDTVAVRIFEVDVTG